MRWKDFGMVQSFTPRFERMVLSALDDLGRKIDASLARDVMALSDFYLAHPGVHTPWHEPFARPAYVSYFQPLNYARLRAVFNELKRFLPPETIREVWDFGSGIGATHWALEDEDWLPPRPLYCLERAREATEYHRRLAGSTDARWTPEFISLQSRRRPEPGALAVFSYSFLEMRDALPLWQEFEHILILEPSTRECGRQLQAWRVPFMDKGFTPLAPCTHASDCPLLLHSNKDWCHARIALEPPEWFQTLESLLPMKNRTLTYSYLLLSRGVRDEAWRGAARVIGDTLEERGKTRQMICRGPEREFLSWLHRHGEPARIPSGALLRGTESCTLKGSELRVEPSSGIEWTE
ncbi:MAG: hypothetical protein HC902_12970 [Calothrix sp. SM1_5_4]|nr:hypothetical protein [Calothrix sp. SM1_5_4]